MASKSPHERKWEYLDEDGEPRPLPLWVPGTEPAERPLSKSSRRMACAMILLGIGGLVTSVVLPGATTEAWLGGALLVLGIRVLIPEAQGRH